MNAPARILTPASEVEAPARHRFTVDDVTRMVEAGLIDGDARTELLDGELIDMPSEGELHLTLKILLNAFLVRNLPLEVWIAPDATLHLDPTDAPEPDIYAVVAGARLKPVEPAGVLLIVEIADSSLGYDLGRKAGKYAQYGVAEYWVVDAQARRTHVLRAPEGGAYHDITTVPFDRPLRPLRLAGVELVVAELPGLKLD